MGLFQDIGRTLGFTKSKGQGSAPARRKGTTVLQDPRGEDLFGRISARARGEGLGISEKELDPASATFATRQRRAFRENTLPLISQQASARGLGRSTIPINRAALEGMKTEESIAERIANQRLQNEFLKRQEQSTAIGREGSLIGTDVSQQNAETQAANLFDKAEFLRQQGFRQAADKAQQDALTATRDAVVSIAGGSVAGGAGFLPGVEEGGFGKGAVAGASGDFGLFKPSASGITQVFGQDGLGGLSPAQQEQVANIDAQIAALEKQIAAEVQKV